ncbi:MAG: hypothetical protein KatS3mg111_3981 [Pirellulaceae bacterium]|nr:MAG: hypothetical protein KatS3mg111_3981 [Pirellulaceae bacterium]
MSNAGEHIRYRIRLRPDHKPTGNTTHTVGGIVVEPPFELRIVQFDGDPGFYLIHFNENEEELADTYHDSCEQAMEQAEFEFGIKREDWR